MLAGHTFVIEMRRCVTARIGATELYSTAAATRRRDPEHQCFALVRSPSVGRCNARTRIRADLSVWSAVTTLRRRLQAVAARALEAVRQ